MTVPVRSRWRALYGAGPGHLLVLAASLAVAGYAASRAVAADPRAALQMALWFGGAVVAHDLVLFPLYALADRALTGASGARRPPSVVQHVRVPLALSGLLLVVFLPVITRHSEDAYRAASGLDQQPYLSRWLLLSALFVLVSAGTYAGRAALARHRARSARRAQTGAAQ